MQELFRGWKRKVGVVTLVMACVSAAGWMRSTDVADAIFIPTGEESTGNDTTDVIWSSNSRIAWGRFLQSVWNGDSRSIRIESNELLGGHLLGVPPFFNDNDTEWDLSVCGFGIGSSRTTPMTSMWVISYWSIVPPLTLLSAWLLLSKPRAIKAQQTPEL